MLQYLLNNWKDILMAVVGIDYALLLVFPQTTGVGGVLAKIGQVISDVLKGAGVNPPAPPAKA